MTKVLKSASSSFVILHSTFVICDSLESLWVPVRFRDRSLAFVFEKFVDGREDDTGAAGLDANIEVEPVLEKIDVAVADHAEEFAGHFEVIGVNDTALNRESGLCGFGDAVAGAGNDCRGQF